MVNLCGKNALVQPLGVLERWIRCEIRSLHRFNYHRTAKSQIHGFNRPLAYPQAAVFSQGAAGREISRPSWADFSRARQACSVERAQTPSWNGGVPCMIAA